MKKILCACLAAVLICFTAAPAVCLAADTVQSFDVAYTGKAQNMDTGTLQTLSMHANTGKYQMQLETSYTYCVFLADTISFKSGFYYTVNYGNPVFGKSGNSPAAESVVVDLRLSLANSNGIYVSDVHIFASDGYLYPPTVTFYCAEDFTCDRIYVYSSSDTDYEKVYYAFDKSFSYEVRTGEDYQSAILSGAIQNQTNQIISGEGLTPAPGIDTDDVTGTIGGISGAEGAIGDAIGGFDGVGDQLDSIMNPTLDSSITASFAKINTVFSKLVTTFDISAALTFMLVFGLALFVIGRRVR